MQPARDTSISRRRWLLAGAALPLSLAHGEESIHVSYDGETVRPVAPNLHFLTGKALERLKDADTVTYIATLLLLTVDQSEALTQIYGKFVLSYDILEEKFKAVVSEPATRSRAGMSAAQAEAWCLDNLAIKTAGLAPDRLFFLRLEVRAAGPKEQFDNVMANPVRSLLDMLSRKAGPGEQHWGPFESRPLRLNDLVHASAGQGARNG
ncbi:MAG TPA: hypothetical protein VMU19_04060 [Bryobacteraceae bacterium]|nr:hypothetical protein [Bryobacteraceae bacterium]